jgi:hypothetical protein
MEITAAVRRVFVPVTITLNSEVEVANVLGALIAYGTASVFAENALKAIGLGEFYSGNVRKAARIIATELVSKTDLGVNGLEDLLEAYLDSEKFRKSAPSQAGAKVIGTADDLAPGREATSFESGEASEEIESDEVSDYEDSI